MNFFEHQDRARKQTGRLIVLFCLAVLGIVAAVNVAVYFVIAGQGGMSQGQVIEIHLIATAVTMMIIVGGAAYKTAALSSGGESVARMLGGRPIDVTHEKEAVLQNIVEEMSIASGVPVPSIYVMDKEDGINAFAAGITPDDMVIGVTKGTLQRLSRDELQGVIGHEYSHILNGDTKLNLRLISVLNGIMVISLIGLMLVRSTYFMRFSSRRNNNQGGAILAAIGAGIFMYLLGSIGVLFGRLIQSAVSRQREFLADASAVQFTRNPKGLAGALKKIGAQGSMVHSPHAMEAAHLFFGSATRFSLAYLLATHPPLDKRIKAIDPTWDGQFDVGPSAAEALDQYVTSRRGDVLAGMLAGAGARRPLNPRQVIEHAGEINPAELEFASGMLGSLPPALVEAAHHPFSARAVVFALLLHTDPAIRQKQFEAIEKNVELACYQPTLRLAGAVSKLPAGARLPLLEVALPALRSVSQLQATAVRIVMRKMIEADRKVTLFEYTLRRLVEKRLPTMQLEMRQPIEFYNVSAIRREAGVLLSALAEASATQTEQAFAAGARALDPANPPEMAKVDGLGAIDAALQRLSRSSPAVKKRLIDAAAHTVAADGQVNVVEAELLRATAATLDVPLPPMVTV